MLFLTHLWPNTTSVVDSEYLGENPLDISEMKEQAETKSYTPPKKSGQTDRSGTGILDNLGSVVNIF